MTPDEVVKVLEEFNRSPFTKANLSGNEWTAWKKEIMEANIIAISLIQDYQKLREKLTVEKIKEVLIYEHSPKLPLQPKVFNDLAQAIITYLQQPTEH